MEMRIQHNITAMNAYRNYNNNTSAIGKNLEKLSSGYKINRAGDDAAGLAVSQKMRLQIAGLAQAQKNAKSGISYVQTAEGALTEVHDMLERMYTLAEQSANGTYDLDTDRTQLQKELNQLRTEINRIGKTANFNGIGLFSTYAGGSGSSNTAVPAVTLDTAANNAGISTTDGDVSFSFAANATDEQKAALNSALGKDGSKLTVTVGNTKKELSVSGLEGYTLLKGYDGTSTVNAANGKITLATNSSATALKNSANTTYELTLADAEGNEVGVLKFKATVKDGTSDIAIAAGEPAATYEAKEGAAKTLADYDIASIDMGDVELTEDATVSAEYTKNDKILHLFVGDTEYKSTALGTTAAAPANGKIELTDADGNKISVTLAGTVNVLKQATNGVEKAELGTMKAPESASGISFWVGAEYFAAEGKNQSNKLDLGVMDLSETSIGMADGATIDISEVDITTADKAMSYLDTIKQASNSVSDMRGTLGALQNRLDHTINNLSVMQENMQDAESVIRDTDVAEEMMAYTKNNILVQSAQAMLAQANQLPQGVLQLLG